MRLFGNMRSEPCVNAATNGEYACGQRPEPEIFSQLLICRAGREVVLAEILLVQFGVNQDLLGLEPPLRKFCQDDSIQTYTPPMVGAIILVSWLLCVLGIPAFSAFSIREWASSNRTTLPAVRNVLAVASVVVVLAGWLFLVTLTVLALLNDAWTNFFTERRNVELLLLAIIASLSCLTLKGTARWFALGAGTLLVLFTLLWFFRDMP